MLDPLISAYMAGAATVAIAQLTMRRIRRVLATHKRNEPTTPAPAVGFCQRSIDDIRPTAEPRDPRAEALAVLEFTLWNFRDAYTWTRKMRIDSGNFEYWTHVIECVEIFEAGKHRRRVAA